MGNYEPYFKVMKQVAAERGAAYSFGRDWAAVDSTRDGERVVVEAGFYTGEEGAPYFEIQVFEWIGPDDVYPADAATGATTAELLRFVEKWV